MHSFWCFFDYTNFDQLEFVFLLLCAPPSVVVTTEIVINNFNVICITILNVELESYDIENEKNALKYNNLLV